MFTGIISALGTVRDSRLSSGGRRLVIDGAWPGAPFQLGESVAIDGACMTVVQWGAEGFSVDVSPESLALTTLGALQHGARVNLERALRLGDAVGGHLVSGHVDGKGALVTRRPEGDCAELTFRAPPAVLRVSVHKGSIAVAGISLTINRIDDSSSTFTVMVIPHTLLATTLGALAPGDVVNLEADQLGKMVERLLVGRI